MMTIILNQQKLADVVHDPDLRYLLAAALEYEGDEPSKLAALREYLIHNGLADKVTTATERPKSVWESDEDNDE